MSASIWRVLGIGKTDDKGAIRRAYAAKLKALDLDKDVAAYAALRQARDAALRQSGRSAAPPAGDLAMADDGELMSAGAMLDDATAPITGLDVFPAQPDKDAPVAPMEEGPDQRVVNALRGLAEIVFPEGNYSDAGFTMDEYQAGRQLVAALLEEARTGRLELAHAVDHHLAEMMAEGWPRSAALIEEPATEFHWLDEAGSLDERPALRFLNDRIRGMRFTENVQRPDHRLHKAWVELSREGEKLTFAQKRAVQKDDISQLLDGIRKNFPEVEGTLNRERVDMWDRRLASGGGGGGYWSGEGLPLIGIGIGIVVFLRIMGAVASSSSSPTTQTLPEPPPLYSSEAFSEPEDMANGLRVDSAVIDVVGEAVAGRLRNEASGFRYGLEGAYLAVRNGGGDHAAGIVAALRYSRTYALAARHNAGFDDLVAIDEVLRLWLQAAARDGMLGADCPYLPEGDIGTITLDGADRQREQALYGRLLDAGLLQQPAPGGSVRANIPPPVFAAMIERSGLSEETVAAALQDQNHVSRCRVILAGLEEVLARPAEVPEDLLRVF